MHAMWLKLKYVRVQSKLILVIVITYCISLWLPANMILSWFSLRQALVIPTIGGQQWNMSSCLLDWLLAWCVIPYITVSRLSAKSKLDQMSKWPIRCLPTYVSIPIKYCIAISHCDIDVLRGLLYKSKWQDCIMISEFVKMLCNLYRLK